VALLFAYLGARLPRSLSVISTLEARYPGGRGLLRELLKVVSAEGFLIEEVSTGADDGGARGDGPGLVRMVEVTFQVHGKRSVNELAAALSGVPDVRAAVNSDVNAAIYS